MAPARAVKPVREWMGDRRVAAALAAVALLFVGYRVVTSYRPSQPPPPAASEAVTQPAAGPVEAAPSAAGPPPASPLAPIPPGWSGPSWAWDRNPFLSPPAERSAGRNGAGSAAGARPSGEAAASGDGSFPELRGTVVGREGAMAIFRSQRSDGGNRLVPAGGAIGEWTLSGVEPYRVILRKGKETRVLELYKQ